MEISITRRIVKLLLLLLAPSALSAQQDPMYSMYMFNPLSINPAYAGSLDQFQAVGMFRRQWMKFPGSPGTSTCTVHGPLKNKTMGLGLSMMNDQVGYFKTTSFMVSYAYKLKLEKTTLAFGLQTGVRNFNINLTEVELSPEYKYDAAFANNYSSWNFNFGAGVFWYGEKWYGGLSLPHLNNHLLRDDLLNSDNVSRLRTHMNLYGGYVFDLGSDLKLKPSVLLKSVAGSPVQMDINSNLYYQDLYGIGLSYRTGNAILVLAEVKVNKNFRLGYATDFTVNKLSGRVGATHEIMVRYDFMTNKSGSFTQRDF
jgi:type IX secretion system PorP/SprF family membrane protein